METKGTVTEVRYAYPEKEIEELVFRAAENAEVLSIISQSQGKIEAIKKLRTRLTELFPEIQNLPPAKRIEKEVIVTSRVPQMIDNPLSNDFLVAKNIVTLLWPEEN